MNIRLDVSGDGDERKKERKETIYIYIIYILNAH